MNYKFHSEFDQNKAKGGLFSKFYNLCWGICFFIRYGRPKLVFRFGGGLGDHLLCTILFDQIKKNGTEKVWMMSYYPELFQNNPSVDQVVPDDWKVIKFCQKFKTEVTLLSYGKWIGDTDKIAPPQKHMITEIIEKSGIHGRFCLKPFFYTNHSSPVTGKYVCIQGTNTISSTPVRNKQWEFDKMNAISTRLSKKYTVIQVGLPDEDLLDGSRDFRGKLSMPEFAALLGNSLFFIGQEGFIMHLARSQETRSVIIYGGRIKAWQSGYPCNENVETNPPCSPCWQNNKCDHSHLCMTEITIDHVLQAVERLEMRLQSPLETDELLIPKNS